MSAIHDSEFGDIAVHRNARAKHIRVKVAPNGLLRVTMPPRTPLFLAKRLISQSRDELRSLLQESLSDTTYTDGMQIGKTHTLQFREGTQLKASRQGNQLTVWLPPGSTPQSEAVTRLIREQSIKLLRREAKSYLPRRLRYLAEQHGFSYQRVAFPHASSRWGSCSSSGTISLNIALMKLPFELIDYVIMHELAHTRYMNHSNNFWELVATLDPQYTQHRAALKLQSPTI